MGREPAEIRRDIADTRQEIDSHLAEVGGRVERARTEFDVQRQARERLPQILGGVAVAGLALGLLIGHGGRRHYFSTELAAEDARLAREWRRLARERQRMAKATTLGEIGFEESSIP